MKLSQNSEVEDSPSMEETNVPHQVKWDKKLLKKKMEEADDFISRVCQFLPKHLKKTDSDEEKDNEEEGEEDNGDDEVEENDEESDDENDNPEEKPKKLNGVVPKSRAKTIAELHKRLVELKEKKGGYNNKLLKKGLKNRIRKKQKLEERRQQKLLSRKIKGGGDFVPKLEESKQEPQTRNIKPIYNAEGNMVFSKFDFTDSRETKKTDRDPKRALQRIEKVKSKIKKLEDAGQVEKVVDLKEKQLWKSAIQRAEGIKVKDNEELLKKTIKKKQQQKNKSKKQWEQREEQVKKKKDDAQKKRKENIGQRKKEKKQKKIKKAIKKGRMVAQ